jgi:nucleotide-binding universal stress UspA family protein
VISVGLFGHAGDEEVWTPGTSLLGGAMKTYYEILGASKRATKEEIEKAYQKITNAGYVVFTDGLAEYQDD